MIQNENNSSRKIKENKYKILRMSLLLGTDTDKEETINNFEDAAREIDFMNNETYLSELENKFYDTQTLEEESKKLTDLVDYIAGRISQRESLISDFINVTGRNLTGLGEIKYENKLTEYQDRLKYINEYLDNTRKIEEENEELEKLRNNLTTEVRQKEENEKKNEELEDLLRKKFTKVASDKIDIDSLTEENIDEYLNELQTKTEESKKSLDIFTKSFETLRNAGLNYEDEIEYKSYVTGARDVYYEYKEEEYFLNIYKLLLSNETEYIKIYSKRECISEILNERLELRRNLEIGEPDVLDSLYSILANQSQIVEGQKENIDNITSITDKIKYCEERIEELNEDNEKVEILSILKEYNIIDTIDTYEEEPKEEIKEVEEESFEIPELSFSEVEPEEVQEEPVPEIETSTPEEKEEPEIELPINKPYKNNFVMGSHDPMGLNVEECIEKATNVMRRVGKMLNIVPSEEEKEETPQIPVVETPEIEEKPSEPQAEIPTTSPFLNPEVETSPFVKNEEVPIEEKVETNIEQSNTKNVLPDADSFWNSPKSEQTEYPDITVSNDDFFANNMDNFEFPNLDEFK